MSNDNRVHRFIVLAFSVLVFWGLPLANSVAQEQEVAAAGKLLFADNCMVCHGDTGKGDGIMVTFSLLTVQPPDLTQLGSRNGGHFPFWKVYRMIDGREVVKGHGTQDMPLWGDEFRLEAGSSLDAQTQIRGKILQLVYYLQSLQAKSDAPAVKDKTGTGQSQGR
jgi:mono/diheme cytochrome c family protein